MIRGLASQFASFLWTDGIDRTWTWVNKYTLRFFFFCIISKLNAIHPLLQMKSIILLSTNIRVNRYVSLIPFSFISSSHYFYWENMEKNQLKFYWWSTLDCEFKNRRPLMRCNALHLIALNEKKTCATFFLGVGVWIEERCQNMSNKGQANGKPFH